MRNPTLGCLQQNEQMSLILANIVLSKQLEKEILQKSSLPSMCRLEERYSIFLTLFVDMVLGT